MNQFDIEEMEVNRPDLEFDPGVCNVKEQAQNQIAMFPATLNMSVVPRSSLGGSDSRLKFFVQALFPDFGGHAVLQSQDGVATFARLLVSRITLPNLLGTLNPNWFIRFTPSSNQYQALIYHRTSDGIVYYYGSLTNSADMKSYSLYRTQNASIRIGPLGQTSTIVAFKGLISAGVFASMPQDLAAYNVDTFGGTLFSPATNRPYGEGLFIAAPPPRVGQFMDPGTGSDEFPSAMLIPVTGTTGSYKFPYVGSITFPVRMLIRATGIAAGDAFNVTRNTVSSAGAFTNATVFNATVAAITGVTNGWNLAISGTTDIVDVIPGDVFTWTTGTAYTGSSFFRAYYYTSEGHNDDENGALVFIDSPDPNTSTVVEIVRAIEFIPSTDVISVLGNVQIPRIISWHEQMLAQYLYLRQDLIGLSPIVSLRSIDTYKAMVLSMTHNPEQMAVVYAGMTDVFKSVWKYIKPSLSYTYENLKPDLIALLRTVDEHIQKALHPEGAARMEGPKIPVEKRLPYRYPAT